MGRLVAPRLAPRSQVFNGAADLCLPDGLPVAALAALMAAEAGSPAGLAAGLPLSCEEAERASACRVTLAASDARRVTRPGLRSEIIQGRRDGP